MAMRTADVLTVVMSHRPHGSRKAGESHCGMGEPPWSFGTIRRFGFCSRAAATCVHDPEQF
jgi:hypothetical protein